MEALIVALVRDISWPPISGYGASSGGAAVLPLMFAVLVVMALASVCRAHANIN
jgi:hypothetical protein